MMKGITFFASLAILFASIGCQHGSTVRTSPAPDADPADEYAESAAEIIPELEARVKENPKDFIAYNKLSAYYLQRQRETGDTRYLELAARAAKSSLAIVPAAQNGGALAALAQSEQASHEFALARQSAEQLIQIDPRKVEPKLLLADALLELGEYERAEELFKQIHNEARNITSESRLARIAQLHGRTDEAKEHLAAALDFAKLQVPRQRETVAWCQWQLGELAFAKGDYPEAERQYREALKTFADYYRASASLARVRGAQGDLSGATKLYEQVTKRLPDPAFVAALGDLYKLAGRQREAQTQYTLVEQIARLSAFNGQLYNRQLALFYADHDLNQAQAYALATREYQVRQDIYGADAVAWTALHAGKLAEAQAAMKQALRLGTRDAKLLYHAAMIARAAGDKVSAADQLKRALALSPQFDPLQVTFAQRALAE